MRVNRSTHENDTCQSLILLHDDHTSREVRGVITIMQSTHTYWLCWLLHDNTWRYITSSEQDPGRTVASAANTRSYRRRMLPHVTTERTSLATRPIKDVAWHQRHYCDRCLVHDDHTTSRVRIEIAKIVEHHFSDYQLSEPILCAHSSQKLGDNRSAVA